MVKNYEALSKKYYDQHAKKFDRSFDGFLSSFFKHYIVKHIAISDGMSILDIGSATGKLLKQLSKDKNFQGVGLDISSEMTKLATKNYPEFSFVTGSAMQLPFSDAQFDILMCSASFHHFPDPKRFLSEALRVLKPGGKLVIAEIRIPLFHRLYNWYINKCSKEGDVRVYEFEELFSLLESESFILIKGQKWLQIQYFEAYKKILNKE